MRKSKYVLLIIAVLLLVSGGLRLVVGSGPALAFAQEQMTNPPEAEVAQMDQDTPPVSDLLSALQARETRVSEREIAIEDRLRALALAEGELTERLQQLIAAEASLTEALTLSETANDTDIARLITVYENMKPADAAGLFAEMAPEFASGFLVRMRPDVAAAILAGLEPQTAYSISAIIAGRNANAPTQ